MAHPKANKEINKNLSSIYLAMMPDKHRKTAVGLWVSELHLPPEYTLC